jgi:predicted acetyltransferase
VTNVEIRPLGPDDDLDAQIDLGERAFGPMTQAGREQWRKVAAACVRHGAVLGAFVAGRPAGAASFYDMRQWWRGQSLPMAGVASVKVAPEHRGRGIGRQLMTSTLDLIAERGYPLSALYPATMPIYRSLGWELGGSRYTAVLPSRELRSLMRPDAALPRDIAPADGTAVDVRRASPGDAASVIAVIGRAHAAAGDNGPLTWDDELTGHILSNPDDYTYLADDGFAAYRWHGGSEELRVRRVHGVSAETVRALWSVIASHSSVAERVNVRLSPNDPLWWLARERDVALIQRSMWMLRVVDAPAAIGARGFPPGVSLSVPLVIADEARPANAGPWLLEIEGGKGALVPDGDGSDQSASTRAPLTLGARGLAALYAGTPVSALRLAGLAAGGEAGRDAALEAAFAGTSFMLDDF